MSDLFKKLAIDIFDSIDEVINESGIRNIKSLAKYYKKAEIWFHKDLDGVTSAIAMKEYLKSYNVKTVNVYPIQYGDDEFAAHKPTRGYLHVMVDFAHGRQQIHIHTDHHDKQTGFSRGASTAFSSSKANVIDISKTISIHDIFPNKDLELIAMVDSADFAKYNLTPSDIANSVFKIIDSVNVDMLQLYFGLVVNKLVLSYKNKKGFLEQLVLKANPSLLSMYNVIKATAKKEGYPDGKAIKSNYAEYVKNHEKSEKSIMKQKVIMQYGGAAWMGKVGSYDRYTPFKKFPDAEYLCICWPMGLIQITKNPFIAKENPYNLADIGWKVVKKYKSKLSIPITLLWLKQFSERKVVKKDLKDSMNFTFNDVIAQYQKELKGYSGTENAEKFYTSLMSHRVDKLSIKQKAALNKVTISLWDIIKGNSGGHKDITNFMPFGLLGKGYVDLMKKIWKDMGNALAKLIKENK